MKRQFIFLRENFSSKGIKGKEKKNREFNEHASFQRAQREIFIIIARCHLEK